MRIALASCATLPAWEIDDAPVHAALRERGVALAQPSWDDPAVDWASFDLVVVRTTWDYQQKLAAFLDWLERVAACTRLLNPAAIVRWNLDKTYLRELETAGVALAPTVWFEAGRRHDLAAALAGRGIERGFLKPVVAANARGTLRFDARDPTALAGAQAFLDEHTPGEAMMLQPYLAQVEVEGELSAIFFDDVFSHAVRKVPVAGDYRVQDTWGARDEAIELDGEAAALAARTLAALARVARRRGWTDELPLAYARVDMLRADDGALVLNELEIAEPSLFFRHGPEAAARMVAALLARGR